MVGEDDDLIQPPPGGYLREPRPDSTHEAEQDALERAESEALERVAAALESLEREVSEIRKILSDRIPPPSL